MEPFVNNIRGIFGQKGEVWLDRLPAVVSSLAQHWKLKNIAPVPNMTFNYVAKATTESNHPVILKIGCDAELIDAEKHALAYFKGSGSIKLIDFHALHHALLLQQALPGTTLKFLYPHQMDFVIDAYSTVVKQLHRPLVGQHPLHISDWLTALDKVPKGKLPENLLTKAMAIRDKLLASSSEHVFLHGDLHHDNIIQHEDRWLAIDPKGIVGEPAFEVAAFDFIHSSEMDDADCKALLEARVKRLSFNLNLDPEQLKEWVFVRILLSAAWWVEDRGDPSKDVHLAERLFL